MRRWQRAPRLAVPKAELELVAVGVLRELVERDQTVAARVDLRKDLGYTLLG